MIRKIEVIPSVYWVEVPDVDLKILCGAPADSVKHLMKKGFITTQSRDGVEYESGPNAILLSDVMIQNGHFSNLGEFPVLQMLYKQGMILPNHPNNRGDKPILIGSQEQVEIQLQYIYRGNYGLITFEELRAAGMSEDEAKQWMEIKLKFAFGEIKDSRELLESCLVDSHRVEIKSGVFIERVNTNRFKISYGSQSVEVNLNLKGSYRSPYALENHLIKRDFFSVIHTGQGDGWDSKRPSMGSIIVFQGRIFLIDVGPNILYILNALGVGINEIEGVFHTHSHDDHFAGLPALIQSDKKIKYYATAPVRLAVSKKLSSLLLINENAFYDYFDVYDLPVNEWSSVNGLNVKPIYSPHPVETNVFLFKSHWHEGDKTYMHLADIVSLDVLKKMSKRGADSEVISEEFIGSIMESYLTPVTLKKIDVGGGLIHGDVKDFKNDKSEKIVIAHTSFEESNAEYTQSMQIVPFGDIDTLIPSHQDFLMHFAGSHLKQYFPDVDSYGIYTLLNRSIIRYSPDSSILKFGQKIENVSLILTGIVEVFDENSDFVATLSAGTIIGDRLAIWDEEFSNKSYKAKSHAQILPILVEQYVDFIKSNDIYSKFIEKHDMHIFLEKTWLLGESISYPVMLDIMSSIEVISLKEGEVVSRFVSNSFCIVKSGLIERFLNDIVYEEIKEGEYFGEEESIFNAPAQFHIRAREGSTLYVVDTEVLKRIPMVHWKLFERYEKRKNIITQMHKFYDTFYDWRHTYAIGVDAMDTEHKETLLKMENLAHALDKWESPREILNASIELIDTSLKHIENEDRILEEYKYGEREAHKNLHALYGKKLLWYRSRLENGKEDFGSLLDVTRRWFVSHIQIEDRKYSIFLNSQGIF